jgi:hypothetical protein
VRGRARVRRRKVWIDRDGLLEIADRVAEITGPDPVHRELAFQVQLYAARFARRRPDERLRGGAEVGGRARTTAWAISSCTAKTSVRVRS